MKLTLLDTIKVLLEKGNIAVKENKLATKREITVCKPHPLIKGATSTVGYINQKTLITLINTEFITLTQETRQDKYGNTYWFYESNIQTIDNPNKKESQG